jgi:hypothetical protein
MPSYLHELLLTLFRNHPASATDLLRGLEVQLPEHDEVRTESSDISDLKPAEYRADSVLFLVRESQYVLGIVVPFVCSSSLLRSPYLNGLEDS